MRRWNGRYFFEREVVRRYVHLFLSLSAFYLHDSSFDIDPTTHLHEYT